MVQRRIGHVSAKAALLLSFILHYDIPVEASDQARCQQNITVLANTPTAYPNQLECVRFCKEKLGQEWNLVVPKTEAEHACLIDAVSDLGRKGKFTAIWTNHAVSPGPSQKLVDRNSKLRVRQFGYSGGLFRILTSPTTSENCVYIARFHGYHITRCTSRLAGRLFHSILTHDVACACVKDCPHIAPRYGSQLTPSYDPQGILQMNITCHDGFWLPSNASTILKCNLYQNATWDHSPSFCQRLSCALPPHMQNHVLSSDPRTTVVNNKNEFYSVALACPPGFMFDPAIGGSTALHTCTLSLNNVFHWQPPISRCVRVPCQLNLTNPSNGKVVKNGSVFESQAVYTCNTGFMISNQATIRTCNADGEWSGCEATCDEDCTMTSTTATFLPLFIALSAAFAVSTLVLLMLLIHINQKRQRAEARLSSISSTTPQENQYTALSSKLSQGQPTPNSQQLTGLPVNKRSCLPQPTNKLSSLNENKQSTVAGLTEPDMQENSAYGVVTHQASPQIYTTPF